MQPRQHLRNRLDDNNPLPMWPLVTWQALERAERYAFEIGREDQRRQPA